MFEKIKEKFNFDSSINLSDEYLMENFGIEFYMFYFYTYSFAVDFYPGKNMFNIRYGLEKSGKRSKKNNITYDELCSIILEHFPNSVQLSLF